MAKTQEILLEFLTQDGKPKLMRIRSALVVSAASSVRLLSFFLAVHDARNSDGLLIDVSSGEVSIAGVPPRPLTKRRAFSGPRPRTTLNPQKQVMKRRLRSKSNLTPTFAKWSIFSMFSKASFTVPSRAKWSLTG
jgi:hypothetical protein